MGGRKRVGALRRLRWQQGDLGVAGCVGGKQGDSGSSGEVLWADGRHMKRLGGIGSSREVQGDSREIYEAAEKLGPPSSDRGQRRGLGDSRGF